MKDGHPYINVFVVKNEGFFHGPIMMRLVLKELFKKFDFFWFVCLAINFKVLTPFFRLLDKVGIDAWTEEVEDPYIKIGVHRGSGYRAESRKESSFAKSN